MIFLRTVRSKCSFVLGGWELRICEEGALSIFGADDGLQPVQCFKGPLNFERRVVPEDGALAGGVVKIGGFVKNLCGVGENEEAVSEPFGDPKELQVAYGRRFEVETSPLAEVWRIGPQVYCHIPDMAGEDTDELSLGFAKLVMEASQDSSVRERLVVLGKLAGQPGCRKR